MNRLSIRCLTLVEVFINVVSVYMNQYNDWNKFCRRMKLNLFEHL